MAEKEKKRRLTLSEDAMRKAIRSMLEDKDDTDTDEWREYSQKLSDDLLRALGKYKKD